ncbi:sulfatase [Mahella australiensis]|uniref:Sulfatase n=1 Tax=Mahella australiensis (strain DSM 15567 / CIP 107919 / 50-1 BON) TaxID=697281 RepID=F3ZW30_MAHA5|nr:sulfatase [Mahella australiensis]AEE96410.1 sulfatase [Mahella australiensis 50-1 BON]
MSKMPNLILIGIDSLRADHMSLYGYDRLTTPHMDKFAAGGVVFEHTFSPHIPTTSGYSCMLTGMDCFGTNVVALRHKGDIAEGVPTLAEVLGENGYNTTCVGFKGNPASRGFHNYLEYAGWGSYAEGRSPKAENLNEVAIPELKRLAGQHQPFFLFLRHMDPHAPYLPPSPFERMFYGGNEYDKANQSLKPVYEFKPFRDFFMTWFPPGCTDKDYIIAQYDGAIAYMDACIQNIFEIIEAMGIDEETLIVITADHGETLYDHECWFDHHGLYDCTLTVPLILRYPGKVPAAKRYGDYCQLKDVMPTILELMGIDTQIKFNGSSLAPLMRNELREPEPEFYITECTWMRKHGWRTPEWKFIHALEPDFHFKPEIELYNLIKDPGENHNIAEEEPEVVSLLENRMQAFIKKRESEIGRSNPMYTNLDWHGLGCGPFKTSQQAYDMLHIGSPEAAQKIQAMLETEDKENSNVDNMEG